MNIKTESKTTIETKGYFNNGILKNYPCDLGDWYGDEICKKVDFNEVIDEMGLPKGEYRILVTLERIDD